MLTRLRVSVQVPSRWRIVLTSGDGAGLAQVPATDGAGLAMAFKLIESAQDHWRMVNAPHLVALVRAGATFTNGKLAGRPGHDGKEAEPEAA